MNDVLGCKFKKVFLLLCGYISFVAFSVIFGFVAFKSTDFELKKTAKTCFFVTLVFVLCKSIVLLLSCIGQMFDGYSSSTFCKVLGIAGLIISVAKIITYAVLIVLELVKKDAVEIKQ